MKIRPLFEKDRASLLSLLIRTRAFTSPEIGVAMELIDIVLKDPVQKDYQIVVHPQLLILNNNLQLKLYFHLLLSKCPFQLLRK